MTWEKSTRLSLLSFIYYNNPSFKNHLIRYYALTLPSSWLQLLYRRHTIKHTTCLSTKNLAASNSGLVSGWVEKSKRILQMTSRYWNMKWLFVMRVRHSPQITRPSSLLTSSGMEKLHRSTAAYVKSISRKNEANDRDKSSPIGHLGTTMINHGEDFEQDSEYGNCLISKLMNSFSSISLLTLERFWSCKWANRQNSGELCCSSNVNLAWHTWEVPCPDEGIPGRIRPNIIHDPSD